MTCRPSKHFSDQLDRYGYNSSWPFRERKLHRLCFRCGYFSLPLKEMTGFEPRHRQIIRQNGGGAVSLQTSGLV
jgi:hypothetical protein